MASYESGRHFTQIDSAFGSAFTSRFPVDLAHPTVRQIVRKSLPDTFDGIFLSKGSSEQYSTIAKKGAVALAPLTAQERARRSSASESEQFDAKQFVCRSLTDGRALSVAYASYDRNGGFISDFSLVVEAGRNNDSHRYYELRGSLGDDSEDRVFEVARFDDEYGPADAMTLDEATATDFVTAINLQRGEDAYVGTLEGMLIDIMEASPAVHRVQHGDYSVFDGKELLVSVSREEVITRGVGKLALYVVSMEQKGSIDPITNTATSNTFSLSYDRTRSPRYQADLSSFVHDPNGVIDKSIRANQYEALSSELRDKPEIIFQALEHAMNDLADLS